MPRPNAQRPPLHRLFFALLPEAATAAEIARVAATVKAEKLVDGSWVHASKQHMTLHFIGDYPALPAEEIDKAKLAAATVKFRPFELVLDRVASFRGRRPPCVLRVASGFDTALQVFWQVLRDALVAEGLDANLEKEFTPHLTLAYGDKPLAEPRPIEPIIWPVHQFFLIHNVIGPTPYAKLGPWPLTELVESSAGPDASSQ